jgi:hypothetical protein
MRHIVFALALTMTLVSAAVAGPWEDAERAEALVNEMKGKTCKLVDEHWPDIEALARQLLENGTVNFLGGRSPSAFPVQQVRQNDL